MPSSPCLITIACCASVNFDAFIALRSIPSQENGTENSNSLRGHFREADQGDKHDWQVQKAWSKTIAMGVVPPDFSNGAVAMLHIWASGRIRGDRRRVVWGKCVSVREGMGGCRNIEKKKEIE